MTESVTDTPTPTPAPAELRSEFEGLVVGDLLGPAEGVLERLDARQFRRMRDRYLLGRLAPRATVGLDPERNDDHGVDGDDGVEDAGGERDGARGATMFPSAFGLSFVVEASTESVVVTASWGRYEKQTEEAEEAGEEAPRWWQRVPMEGSRELPLAGDEIAPFAPVDEAPEVYVRGRLLSVGDYKVVDLFLINDQEQPSKNIDEGWLFQAKLAVTGVEGAAVFVGRSAALRDAAAPEGEDLSLELLYRNRVEFGVGHNVAVHEEVSAGDPGRAVRVETTCAPRLEVARVDAPSFEDVELDMKVLAGLESTELVARLLPLVDRYDSWLDREERRIEEAGSRVGSLADEARSRVDRARGQARRLRKGIEVLGASEQPADAFRFMNEAMWQQRVRTEAVTRRRGDESLAIDEAVAQADTPRNRSWRPFQLAFICLNLPALVDPTHEERAEPGLVDLLYFPTGGGKTEAYLGLTAFTFAIRRYQGTVAGRDGTGGIAVLMRYTLRLLTAQQFERAAALICACELIRKRRVEDGDSQLGETPFRLGMWVGASLTPNTATAAGRAIERARDTGRDRGASPIQLSECPWCGTPLSVRGARRDPDLWRTLLFCNEQLGACPFTEAGSPDEGIPVLAVDDDIFRLLPDLLVGTIDKFAQLPWRGPVHMLFGRVERRCTRHGYRSPDLDKSGQLEEHDRHNARNGHPAAETIAVTPLRPPDLIIQDELHLIAGPLGTMSGLYETAIDELASWDVDGKRVRPKVIASTATIRRAEHQARALFARRLELFPPQVLDVEDSFFAVETPVSEAPGRLYLGVCAPGERLKSVEVRVFETLLAAAQTLFERHGEAADPWMTLVGYFSATRELGGMRRLVEDDVSTRLRRADRRGLARRYRLELDELTSRVGAGDLKRKLDALRRTHVPDPSKDRPWPLDVVLATSMISVGVDVQRLGLMCVVGQPKQTAEYIQATSRVGRSGEGPGLVVTIYNWARPRDLSHFERFEHYHATFYRQVEPLSVTPFAARALDRGLTGLLVGLMRQSSSTASANASAQDVDATGLLAKEAVAVIARRAAAVTSQASVADDVKRLAQARLDSWGTRQRSPGEHLGYQRSTTLTPLLSTPQPGEWDLWTCPTSMREVEAAINLLLRADGDADDIAASWERAPEPSSREAIDGDDAPEEISEEPEE
jgi:Helicase conserved C-terminal domain